MKICEFAQVHGYSFKAFNKSSKLNPCLYSTLVQYLHVQIAFYKRFIRESVGCERLVEIKMPSPRLNPLRTLYDEALKTLQAQVTAT